MTLGMVGIECKCGEFEFDDGKSQIIGLFKELWTIVTNF
jgi:hypothetical protein